MSDKAIWAQKFLGFLFITNMCSYTKQFNNKIEFILFNIIGLHGNMIDVM